MISLLGTVPRCPPHKSPLGGTIPPHEAGLISSSLVPFQEEELYLKNLSAVCQILKIKETAHGNNGHCMEQRIRSKVQDLNLGMSPQRLQDLVSLRDRQALLKARLEDLAEKEGSWHTELQHKVCHTTTEPCLLPMQYA